MGADYKPAGEPRAYRPNGTLCEVTDGAAGQTRTAIGARVSEPPAKLGALREEARH